MVTPELRNAALQLLERTPAVADDFREKTLQQVIYELQVHQVELEMQNEELRRVQMEIEQSRDRFADLFDFAPVGYVTLNDSNRIIEANLTVAGMLAVDRGKLVGEIFSRFVTPDDATRLYYHLREVRLTGAKSSCELDLTTLDRRILTVRLDSVVVANGNCSTAVSDLSLNAELIRARQDSDERLRLICYALPIPIAYADRCGTYQFNNKAHEEWFGVSPGGIAGRRMVEVLGETVCEHTKPYVARALEGRLQAFRLELSGRDATQRIVKIHYAPHRDVNDKVVGFYELMFDARAEQEAAVREDLRREIESLTARQQFVIKQLMNGISNKAIASEMDLGQRTIERERQAILQLLNVESVNELLVKYATVIESAN